MNVTLKPELEKLIEDEVKSGRSSSPDEFLNKAVYHYMLRVTSVRITAGKKSRRKLPAALLKLSAARP
jgi:Arc/MetJ-type ribon-helix-helix transcriptional regulator